MHSLYILLVLLHVCADANASKDARLSSEVGPNEVKGRFRQCRSTRGAWCLQYNAQTRLDYKPPPRGSKECQANCNGVGNCNYDTGICDCSAGWTGKDCKTVQKRPCTNRWRERGWNATSHIDENGRDLNWTSGGWMAGRCGGICDDNTAACYCDGAYKYIPPPKGSPFGTPPVQYGRQLGPHCHPTTTKDGQKTSWGIVSYEKLYGAKGWCEAKQPEFQCGCSMDGYSGMDCNERYEMSCPNQCSGHGVCHSGFCKCYDGWYGLDCARKKAGLPMEPSDISSRWWLQESVQEAPEALDPLPTTPRPRPLIYVYDMNPMYTTRLLQYRIHKSGCIWRQYEAGNRSNVHYNGYGVEMYFHEVLLGSEHRTFDPDAADFFYVPIYQGCFMHPIYGYADFPWWPGPSGGRAQNAAFMVLEAVQWLNETYPFWQRRGGRDHIFLSSHDEGACYYPSVAYNHSIFLTHWGRMDPNHKSGTAYAADDYSREVHHPDWLPGDWRDIWKGHPCYDPHKDLVIPAWKDAEHFSYSPLFGAPPRERHLLMYFRGDVGLHRTPSYSRGVRQKLYQLAQKDGWRQKYNISIGERDSASYSENLASAKFCLVASGDGWSARAEDCIVHGAIPVVIIDGVHSVFETILDWDSFGLRINERSVASLPQILLSIPDDKVARMQRRVRQVWHRFYYTTGKVQRSRIENKVRENTSKNPQIKLAMGTGLQYPYSDDAFHTIMQWLYSRIPSTR